MTALAALGVTEVDGEPLIVGLAGRAQLVVDIHANAVARLDLRPTSPHTHERGAGRGRSLTSGENVEGKFIIALSPPL